MSGPAVGLSHSRNCDPALEPPCGEDDHGDQQQIDQCREQIGLEEEEGARGDLLHLGEELDVLDEEDDRAVLHVLDRLVGEGGHRHAQRLRRGDQAEDLEAGEALRTGGFKLGLIDLRFAQGKGILALVATVWVAAAVGDFFFYWFHRTLHRTPFLWAHHKMHHMDPELEAITVARQNWIEVFIAALSISLPMMIFFKLDNLDPWQLGLVTGCLLTVLSTLLTIGHLNVRWQVGRASFLYCSPQMHRIHHSPLPQHRDRNFAFILPLWDVIFGTYYAPSWDEFPPTGVEGEKEITSFFEAQIFTQREWWRMFRAWRKRRATLSG